MSVLSLVFVNALFNTGAHILLKMGMMRYAYSDAPFWTWLLNLVYQPYIVMGVVFYGTSLILWLNVLSSTGLAYAVVLLMSMTYVLSTLAGVVVFHEAITGLRVFGLVLIIGGIYCVCRSA